jgi:DNA modification methylase
MSDPETTPRGAKSAAPRRADTDGVEGRVYSGDNLALLKSLVATEPKSVALVYLDPPFATGGVFMTRPRDAADAPSTTAYRDAWAPDLSDYVAFMRARLLLVRELLTDDGSLLLHCDFRASPRLALLCDEIFGQGDRGPIAHAPGFRNEIVWSYGLGGSSPLRYPQKHDVIFWYTKGATWTFDPPRVPATSVRMRGLSKKCPDVFTDVPSLNNMARERTGYPTQKPEALLERFVRAHSKPGDVVADFFCGSWTTPVVAAKLGRRFLACDESPIAIETTLRRLNGVAPRPRTAHRRGGGEGGEAEGGL